MAGLNKKELQDAKNLVNEINAAYKEMGKNIKFPMPDVSTTLTDFKSLSEELRAIKADQKEFAEEVEKAARATKSLKDENKKVKESINEMFSGLNSITDEITKGAQGFNLMKKSVGVLTGLVGKVRDIQEDLTSASSEDLKNIQLKAEAERKNLVEAQRLLKAHQNIGDETSKEYIALQNINGMLASNDGLINDLADTLSKVVAQEQKVEKSMGNLGVATESVSGALKTLGMGALDKAMGLSDALDNTKKLAREAAATGEPFSATAHLTKTIGKNLLKAFGPLAIGLAILNQMVKAFKMVDGASGEIAKSQGISAAEGKKSVQLANQQALASGDILISTNDIVASTASLNKLMGTSTQFPAEMALEFAQVSEKIGLSAEGMNFFSKNALKGKGSIMEQLQGVSDITMELNNQNKTSLNLKDIQEGIGKLSASQRLSAKGSAKELANQVFQSKLLGLSSQDLNGVQNSLLDFESSISAEMEAELMTGKQLNLEGARAAALKGDQAALAAEIRKEVGTEAEFMELNVKQREAMAKAFGLNVDQMAEMLGKQAAIEKMQKNTNGLFSSQSEAQEAYNDLIDEGMSAEAAAAKMKELGIDDALAAQMKSATKQDEMNALVERMQDLFVRIVPLIMDLATKIKDNLIPIFKDLWSFIEPIFDTFIGIKDIIETLFDPSKSFSDLFGEMGPVVSGMATAFTVIGVAILGSMVPGLIRAAISAALMLPSLVASAVAAVTTASAMTLGVGAIAIVAGLTAVMVAMESAPTDIGDMMSPASGKTTVSSKEGGLFSLSPNDDLIAAPGAINALSGGGNDNIETNRLLRTILMAIEKGGDVYMDGNKVGKSLALVTSNMG